MPIAVFHRFHRDQCGAVTVDWVVLTGGLLILGIVVAGFISDGAADAAGSAGNRLAEAEVPTIVF